MKLQILSMLELQHAMNRKVHENWQAQEFPWHRAIWVECAELLEHQGWKWWKKQTPDAEQVILELVDIWHFGLSMLMQKSDGSNLTALAEAIEQSLRAPKITDDFKTGVECFVLSVLAERQFPVTQFAGLMQAVDLSFEQLYRMYVGKNMLNFFRQDNGYQIGSYQKHWQGREDNEHLVEILQTLDVSSQTFKEDVYVALGERYQNAIN